MNNNDGGVCMSTGDIYREAAKSVPSDMLSEAFSVHSADDAIRRVSAAKALFKENAEQMGLAGGSVEGLIARNSFHKRLGEEQARRAGDSRRAQSSTAVLLAQLDALFEQRAAIIAQIEEWETQRDQNSEIIKELEAQIEAIDTFIEDFDQNGEIELNADGSVADPDVEAALRAYEERTGQQVDRTNPDALLDALERQRDFARDKATRLTGENNDLQRKIDKGGDDLDDLDDKIQRAKSEMEAASERAEVAGLNAERAERATDLFGAEPDSEPSAFNAKFSQSASGENANEDLRPDDHTPDGQDAITPSPS